jgi:hypothetical protein
MYRCKPIIFAAQRRNRAEDCEENALYASDSDKG